MHDPHAHAPQSALAAIAGAVACLALVAGCSGGAIGDPPSKPLGNPFGDGSRVCELIGPATWVHADAMDKSPCQQPPDHAVYATGVTILAIDRYDETGNGAIGNYYVQDLDPACAGKPYSGVTVFSPSFSPPDLRLANDDVVDVNGQITEFLGPSSGTFPQCRTLPEISGTLSFRFDGGEPPAPVTIPVTDLKTYDTARQWLGMLVKVENLTVFSDPTSSGGRYQAAISVGAVSLPDQPKITNELYDIQTEGPELKAMQTFKSVTGIVTYFYGFHIAPRSAADFEM